MRPISRSALFFALFSTAALHAQDEVLKPFVPDDGKPVMRAVPVRPPKALPADPIDDGSVPPATPVPRATPAPKSPTVRRAKPVKPEVISPARPVAPPPAPEPTEPGDIRIAPQSGTKSSDQVQIEIADGYYSRKMYDMAAPEYQRFVDQYPASPLMEAAMFRLAQSYRQNGANNAAKNTYEALLDRFQEGEFIGPAAYFVAQLFYEEKNYSAALPRYRKASVRLKEPAVVNAAKFFTARCEEAVGSKMDARAIYEELSGVKDYNLFRDASQMSFALLLKDAHSTSEALKQMQSLLKQTENQELQAEAAVHAGLWELELGQNDKAGADLKKALEMPAIGRWKEVADLGLAHLLYNTAKYQEVVDTYTPQTAQFSADAQGELLLLIADSNRQLHKYPEALAAYDQLIKERPASTFAKDAAFQRLACLYNASDAKLPAEIDSFLSNNPDPEKRDEALLMKAENFYKKQDYQAAAPIYEVISKSVRLSGTLRAEALFKLGWCAMQIKDLPRAIKAFTQFIDDYPTNKSLPYALIQRALAYQSQKDLAAAEKDFDLIIRRYPTATKEREIALQQKALIRGQQSDNAAMASTFEQLLKDFPKTAGAPDAHFWIGTSAFQKKDYKKAAENLTAARELDKEHYYERTTLLIMTADYYLDDQKAVEKEIEGYSKSGKAKPPVEILRWLTEQLDHQGDFENEEKYLELLTPREEVQPKDFLRLGETRLKLQKYPKAIEALEKYLSTVKEPQSRALGLLALAKAQIGKKDFGAAQKSVDESLKLQPEGKISGEARIVAGDIQFESGNFEEAAKLFMSVAVILDDEEITPKALDRAVEAYRKAGKDAEAKKTLNILQSRYPEYFQQKKLAK